MSNMTFLQDLKPKMGIKQLMVLSSLAPVILVSILLTIYFNVIRTKELYQHLHIQGAAITAKLSSLVKYEILNANSETLNEILKNTINQEIISASFFDVQGNLIATASNKQTKQPSCLLCKDVNSDLTSQTNAKKIEAFTTIFNETKDSFLFASPISLAKTCSQNNLENINSINLNSRIIIGWSQIEISKIPTKIKAYQALMNSIIITVLAIHITSLLAIRLGKKVTDPILKLAQAVEKISIGKLNTTINTNAKWELAILESGIRSMTLALKNARSRMQKNIKLATMKLKAQNVELNISRKKAEQASKFKSKFLINISHELRTPLNSITGFINLLQKTKLDKWQQEYFNTIKKSSIGLLKLINNILDFSKILYGKLELNLEIMDIRECIDDALGQISFLAHDKELELNAVIANQIPMQIRADSARIKQLITNLTGNLIKYTESGNIVINLVLLKENTDSVTICCNITNNIVDPIAIKKYCSSKQFTNNYKKYNKTNGNYTDIEIGFSICNKIIALMNGIFHIKPNINKGYSFYLIFNAAKIINSDRNITINKNFELPNAKLLLCDLNNISLNTTSSILTSWGLKVKILEETTNLISEIKTQYYAKDPYHMLLIGVNSPLSDPIINKELFTIKQKFHCKIGILVNSTDYAVHNYFTKLGANICLAKPIAYKKTYNALCKVLVPKMRNFIVSQNINDLSVLVVDDNALNLKLITVFLNNLNLKVTAVSSGTEALNIIANKHFHIIFMDILMPDINGIQVANIIRKSNNPNANSIIITLSAHMLLSEQELLKTAGINDYLTKPITEDQLRNTIYKWTQYDNIKETKDVDNQLNIESIPNLDWKLSIKLASGKSKLAKDLFDMMINSLAKEKKLINIAYNENNLTTLREHVHKLHGGCCYTGFSRLKYICKKLEQEIIFKNHNKIEEYLEFLNQEINLLLENYQQFNCKNQQLT